MARQRTKARLSRASRPRLRCVVFEDLQNQCLTFRFEAEDCIDSGTVDSFIWTPVITGPAARDLLNVNGGNGGEEGYCRCRSLGFTICSTECQLRKTFAECAYHAHHGANCGNKLISTAVQTSSFPPVYLDRFPGIGIGVRAAQPIGNRTVIGIYTGRAVFLDKLPKKPSSSPHCYLAELTSTVGIDARLEGTFMRYVNSSCVPNCSMEVWTVHGSLLLAYISNRVIAADEEVTTSYRDSGWVGQCLCRKQGCIGVLTIDSFFPGTCSDRGGGG